MEFPSDQTIYNIPFYGMSTLDDYQEISKLGEGTFGSVMKCYMKISSIASIASVGNTATNSSISNGKKLVALKKIIIRENKEGFPITAFREVTILKQLHHVNILPLLDVVFEKDTRHSCKFGSKSEHYFDFFLVSPFMKSDLSGLLHNPHVEFTEAMIKCFMKQLLEGINYLHNMKYYHRDIKTANLLVDHRNVLKIADFGLARKYYGHAPKASGGPSEVRARYTGLVVTRWYRAPELLLSDSRYTTSVDMWGVGCIFAEFFEKEPILKGKTDINQVELIFELLGNPTNKTYPGYDKLPNLMKVDLTRHYEPNLKRRFEKYFDKYFNSFQGYDEFIDLLSKLLHLDPNTRFSAQQCLNHKYFRINPHPLLIEQMPILPESHEMDNERFKKMGNSMAQMHQGISKPYSNGNNSLLKAGNGMMMKSSNYNNNNNNTSKPYHKSERGDGAMGASKFGRDSRYNEYYRDRRYDDKSGNCGPLQPYDRRVDERFYEGKRQPPPRQPGEKYNDRYTNDRRNKNDRFMEERREYQSGNQRYHNDRYDRFNQRSRSNKIDDFDYGLTTRKVETGNPNKSPTIHNSGNPFPSRPNTIRSSSQENKNDLDRMEIDKPDEPVKSSHGSRTKISSNENCTGNEDYSRQGSNHNMDLDLKKSTHNANNKSNYERSNNRSAYSSNRSFYGSNSRSVYGNKSNYGDNVYEGKSGEDNKNNGNIGNSQNDANEVDHAGFILSPTSAVTFESKSTAGFKLESIRTNLDLSMINSKVSASTDSQVNNPGPKINTASKFANGAPTPATSLNIPAKMANSVKSLPPNPKTNGVLFASKKKLIPKKQNFDRVNIKQKLASDQPICLSGNKEIPKIKEYNTKISSRPPTPTKSKNDVSSAKNIGASKNKSLASSLSVTMGTKSSVGTAASNLSSASSPSKAAVKNVKRHLSDSRTTPTRGLMVEKRDEQSPLSDIGDESIADFLANKKKKL